MEEVAGEQCVGLRAEECVPGLLGGALWCGWQARATKYASDGGGGHAVAEPPQFALDPDVAPAWILCGEALDEGGEFVA
ncbi:hypothetical protein GCM10009753_71160 [Streptantibioticus ferralitis]